MKMVFDLQGVSGKEENAMLDALDKARVRYYMTPRGERGQAGIWVHSHDQAVKARTVLNSAQADWRQQHQPDDNNPVEGVWRKSTTWAWIAIITLLMLVWFLSPVGTGW